MQAEPEEQKPQNDEDVWYTVGLVKGTTFTVTCLFLSCISMEKRSNFLKKILNIYF